LAGAIWSLKNIKEIETYAGAGWSLENTQQTHKKYIMLSWSLTDMQKQTKNTVCLAGT